MIIMLLSGLGVCMSLFLLFGTLILALRGKGVERTVLLTSLLLLGTSVTLALQTCGG